MPDRRQSDNRQPVDLLDVAPTILAILGIERPGYMSGRVLDLPELAHARAS